MRPTLPAVVLAVAVAFSSPAIPDAHAAPPAGSASPAAALPPDAELPPIPPLPPLKPEPVDAEAQKELVRILGKLTSEKADIREAGIKDLATVDAKMVGAIGARIAEHRESLDRDRAPRALEAARKSAREAKKGKKDDAEEDDWLVFMMNKPAPKDDAWR